LQAFDLVDISTIVRNHVIARYWLSHQRFFKYLCIACKVAKVVELSRQAVEDGKVKKTSFCFFFNRNISIILLSSVLLLVYNLRVKLKH
jgi:hypothetical protein